MEDENFVKVNFNDIFWFLNVEDTGEKNGDEPIIKLSWGWNPDNDEEMEEEGWHNESVKILKGQAIKLRDDLDYVISKLNADLFE